MNANYTSYGSISATKLASKAQESSFTQAHKRISWYILIVLLGVSLSAIALMSSIVIVDKLWAPAVIPSTNDTISTDDAATDDVSNIVFCADKTFDFYRYGYDELPYFDATYKSTSLLNYNFLTPYSGVIEPYADMAGSLSDSDNCMSVAISVEVVLTDSVGTNYTLSALNSINSFTSETFSFECNPYDTYTVTSTGYDSTGSGVVASAQFSVVCMYVRRELRELTTDDLNAALDAMYMMWDTSEEEGAELYGSNYHHVDYFASMHNFNAAQQDSDHIHEGLGFLPQHIKITNYFEQSMQAVDPSVSLFYWDTSIEEAEGLTIFESPMFTADTFGSLAHVNNSKWTTWTYEYDDIRDGSINDGRWAHASVGLSSNVYSDIQNGFGFMRGPWNTNPSNRLTRFSSSSSGLPSCKNYFQWLGYTSFSEFMSEAEDGPHASTHGSIGGLFGCDALEELLEKDLILDFDSLKSICSHWAFYMKEMYRGDFIMSRSSGNCSTDSSMSYESKFFDTATEFVQLHYRQY